MMEGLKDSLTIFVYIVNGECFGLFWLVYCVVVSFTVRWCSLVVVVVIFI